MTEAITSFILEVFGELSFLGIIILAMIPVTELRVALPFALSSAWGTHKLTWWQAYLSAVIGSTIPALFIIPLLLPVFAWLKNTKWFGGLTKKLDNRFAQKSAKLNKDVQDEQLKHKKELKKFLGVMLFVAIPLPLTGSWTGSAVASYVKINPFVGMLAVLCGNIISGAIMLSICLLFPTAVNLILYGFIILAVVVIVCALTISAIKNKKQKTVV